MIQNNLNVGDIVYCYKTSKTDKLIHKKGKSYKILYIDRSYEAPWGTGSFYIHYYITIECENLQLEYWHGDTKSADFKPGFCNVFSEHFLCQKQYRKLKLQKLNEIQ